MAEPRRVPSDTTLSQIKAILNVNGTEESKVSYPNEYWNLLNLYRKQLLAGQ